MSVHQLPRPLPPPPPKRDPHYPKRQYRVRSGVINAHQVSADTDPLHERLYRVYNPNSGEHLLTPAGWEVLTLEKAGWKSEGVAFYIPLTEPPYSGYPVVQRLYNPNAGDHHYTTSDFEAASLLSIGWNNDGFCCN